MQEVFCLLAVELGVGELPGEDAPDPALVLVAAPPDVAAALVDRALRTWPEALVADTESWEDLLSTLGVNGWELVQVIPGVETTYWFKRQS